MVTFAALLGVDCAWAQTQLGHPRLWVTASDLPRLRAWATPTNSVYRGGLAVLADYAKMQMDTINTNNIPPVANVPHADDGGAYWQQFPTEMYAELFGFLSLVSTNAADQFDYARRATNLLMYAMNQAALGPDTNVPPAAFRNPMFYTYDRDRPRWYGEGWPLAVDWVYPYLSAGDKQTIRSVFLRWANDIVTNAYAEPPTPAGVTNDPSLLTNPPVRFGAPYNPVRWSGNNYFTAHMRNLGLMAMAFDAADDPGGQLRGYLSPATGGFLYIVDYLLRHDSRGGLLPEGFEYSPQTAAYIAQFLFALHTAGEDDPARWGPQVALTNQPFWGEFIHAYFNSLSPSTANDPNDNDAPSYYAAWYGDGQRIFAPDFINCCGALGLYAYSTGDTNRLNAMRWVEQNLPPGGPDGFLGRAAGDNNSFTANIFYFLLYDPAAAAPTDPRPGEPLDLFVPGMGRMLSRTGWGTNATWLTYKLSWSHVDHQLEDGNQFEWFRRGEWLTRELTGYDLDAGSSDDHNTLALENDRPSLTDTNDPRYFMYLRGSQWGNLCAGDPRILAVSSNSSFVAITGDATPLYNSVYENSTDILHASRSLVWLKPDHLIIYDRANSKTSGRFKRFWLNTPTNAVIAGNLATVSLASGQQLFSTTLLPTNALISTELYTNLDPGAYGIYGFQALLQPMAYRLRVEAPNGPASARFLHVLQGADSGIRADAAAIIVSSRGTPFTGAVAANNAVLFPEDLSAGFTNTTYLVPAFLDRQLITGLAPGTGYTVTRLPLGAAEQVAVSAGGSSFTDSGGVLEILAPPRFTLSLNLDTNVVLFIDGAAGKPVSIQSSTNLADWTTLGQATNGPGGRLQFSEPLTVGSRTRFYRAFSN